MTYDPHNVFARVLKKDLPCEKVDENDYVLAFRDISPKAPVHILVIPKGAYTCFDDFSQRASPEEVFHFFHSLGAIARKMGLEVSGYRVILNNGANGGQEVSHFHAHLMGGKPLGPLVAD